MYYPGLAGEGRPTPRFRTIQVGRSLYLAEVPMARALLEEHLICAAAQVRQIDRPWRGGVAAPGSGPPAKLGRPKNLHHTVLGPPPNATPPHVIAYEVML